MLTHYNLVHVVKRFQKTDNAVSAVEMQPHNMQVFPVATVQQGTQVVHASAEEIGYLYCYVRSAEKLEPIWSNISTVRSR